MFALRASKKLNPSLANILVRNFGKVSPSEPVKPASQGSHDSIDHNVEKNNHDSYHESHHDHKDGHHHHENFEDLEALDKKLASYKNLFGGPTTVDSKLSAQMIISKNIL